MPITKPFKHIGAYAVLFGGLTGYVIYTIGAYEIFPPGMTGRQTWFIDMMDSQNVKAYERPMAVLPEGVVSRNMYVPNADRMTPEGVALSHSYTVDDEFLTNGEWAFGTYCTPCHGTGGLGGGAVSDNSGGKKRYAIPAPALAGAAGVGKMRSDGYIYLTIRNGGAIMPAYGWAMTDEEMWAVVSYIRTLDGAAYEPPAPAGEEG